jgi:hypothetical protein
MTRQLNIDKMKLDAARAILETIAARGWYDFDCVQLGIHHDDLKAIQRHRIDNLSLEKLHAILGRLTP